MAITVPASDRRNESGDTQSVSTTVERQRRRDSLITFGDGRESRAQAGTVAHASRGDLHNLRLPIKPLAMMTRQMAMLLKSGSGIVPALQSIARQFTRPQHAQLMHRVAAELEEGQTLTEALRRFPNTFDSTYCAVVAAGEASGTLAEMFERLAKIVGKRRTMRNKVIGAMAYPVLLSLLSTAIVGLLTMFVIPRFGVLFETLTVPLPASTSMLMGVGKAARTHWLPGTLAIIGLGTLIGFVGYSTRGRRWIGVLMLYIPVVNRLISGLIQAETFRVMGMLTEAKVGLVETIQLAKGITANVKYQHLYHLMESEVTSGGSLSRALEQSGLVNASICHAVHTGEESGQLGQAMTFLADVLDEDNTELLGTLTKLLEPMILVVMGFVVGGVAISLFLPMFDMTSAI